MPAPRLAVLTLLASGVVLGAALWAFDPATAGVFPPCPVLWATGFQCPGCGTLRAAHAVLHGDVRTAFGMNPLAVVAAPFVVPWLVVEALSALGFGLRAPRIGPRAVWVALAVLVVFGVARNVVA